MRDITPAGTAVFILILVTATIAGCGGDNGESAGSTAAGQPSTAPADFQRYEASHFGFFRAGGSYPYMTELNVHWQRPHPGPFVWGQIEKTEGSYDWSQADQFVKDAQDYGILLNATIWPYADWDQQSCHEILPNSPGRFMPTLGDYHGTPCDGAAYQRFLTAMVERYDGDGEDDMPGLVFPIKYWEVINEPDLESDRPFFRGDSADSRAADYLEILKTTSTTIKEADSGAKVLNGGIASLLPGSQAFWKSVLGGGADYIDIVNVHAVPANEDLNLTQLNSLMDELGIDKPVWVTEIQLARARNFGSDAGQGGAEGVVAGANATAAADTAAATTEDEWAVLWVQYAVRAFGNGAFRLFFFGLDNATPTYEPSLLVNCSEVVGGELEEDHLQMSGCQKQKPFYAVKTMVAKIDYFDSVRQLGEGQYQFTVEGRPVYVLWGSGPLPAEISGMVKVTDLSGTETENDAAGIALSPTPVFVELI